MNDRARELVTSCARRPIPALSVMLLVLVGLAVGSLVTGPLWAAAATTLCAVPVAVALAAAIVER